jgi:hypothetical protein
MIRPSPTRESIAALYKSHTTGSCFQKDGLKRLWRKAKQGSYFQKLGESMLAPLTPIT